MSKRPEGESTVPSRARRPFPRLHDLRIRSKLGLILVVPIIAIVSVAAISVASDVQKASDAVRSHSLATLSADAANLVHQLQSERGVAATYLSESVPEAQSGIPEAAKATDAAREKYQQSRESVNGLPATFDSLLKRIDEQVAGLPKLRDDIGKRQVALSGAVFRYKVLIEDLLGIRSSATQLSGDATLSDRMRSAGALSAAKEQTAQERIVVLRATTGTAFTQALQREFIATLTGWQEAMSAFYSTATPEQQRNLEETLTGSEIRQAQRIEGDVITAEVNKPLQIQSVDWNQSMSGKLAKMRAVEQSLDRDTIGEAASLRDAERQQVFIQAGLVLATLLIALLIALVVARAMARSLRDLREGALGVAQHGLPQAVARLRDPAVVSQLTPDEVAGRLAEPLDVRGRDEFGQVATAFNAVHREAVRTAAEQAALRSSVAQMFVNLARRSQILVDRLIGHLDRLEKGEEDPDRLAELFQLDHLATRMRRNDENLLVLAGADSTRIQRDPAPLSDVLRAAQSEVEHYTRIEFGVIDRDLEVAAHAVNDLVHLVAELFDNATAYSPPDTAVVVDARRVGDRTVLQVEDRGIGISPEQLAELNERLATPPQVDVAISRMMGLVVVARLASRHEIRVELRPARERGTVADVLLPAGVLVPHVAAGRQQAMGMPPAPAEAPAVPSQPQRSGFAAFNPRSDGPALGAMPAIGAGPAGAESHSGGFGLAPTSGVPTSGVPTSGVPTSGVPTSGVPMSGAPISGVPMSGVPMSGIPVSGTPISGVPVSGPGSRVPAWYDLTGATSAGGPNGNGPGHHGGPMGLAGDPTGTLPQRRPHESWPPADPTVPRQLPASPEARTGFAPEAPPSTGAEPSRPGGDLARPGPEQGRPGGEMARPGADPARTGPGPVLPPVWPPVGDQPATRAQGGPPEGTGYPVDDAVTVTAEIPVVDRAAPPETAATGTTEKPPAADADTARPAEAAPAAQLPAAQLPAVTVPAPGELPVARNVDDTMELPIFREIESAWFKIKSSAPEIPPPPTDIAPPPEPAETEAPTPAEAPAAGPTGAGLPRRTPTQAAPAQAGPVEAAPAADAPPMPVTADGVSPAATPTRAPTDRPDTAPTPAPDPAEPVPAAAAYNGNGVRTVPAEDPWSTAADAGWQAASVAAEPPVAGTTEAGLPKRVPMAQLVPGGVEERTAVTKGRSPEAVRGLLSAYHRGVQRGRTQRPGGGEPVDGVQSPTEPLPQVTPAGKTADRPPQGKSKGAGKEQEA